MKAFLVLLALTFTAFSLLQGASSIGFPSLKEKHKTFDVTDYGAKGNGKKENSEAFLKAWKHACSTEKISILYVPEGNFRLAPVSFTGPCDTENITVEINGVLNATVHDDETLNSTTIRNETYWLEFSNVNGLTIDGSGTLDGQGASWWEVCSHYEECAQGPASLVLTNTTNTVVRGITSINSKQFHINLNLSINVLVEGVTIHAPANSPDTEGIHVTSRDVHLRNISIKTGDDCIVLLDGTSNITVEGISCGPGHGISVGRLGDSPSAKGVSDITIDGVDFKDTENGVRITSLQGARGSATGLTFQNIVMNNVGNPIVIDQYYCPACAPQETALGEKTNVKISNVVYSNITGTSATKEAINFACSSVFPCQGIHVEDVDLTYEGKSEGSAISLCQNAKDITVSSVNPTLKCPGVKSSEYQF